jgi:hypothetical protein
VFQLQLQAHLKLVALLVMLVLLVMSALWLVSTHRGPLMPPVLPLLAAAVLLLFKQHLRLLVLLLGVTTLTLKVTWPTPLS